MPRSLSEIADDADLDMHMRVNWKRPQNWYVWSRPYLGAMRELDTLDDAYGCDSARDVVLRFLRNAQGWRGEAARAVKAELRGMLDGHP